MASMDLEASQTQISTLHFTNNPSTSSWLDKAKPFVSCMIWALILLLIAISACNIIIWYSLHPRVPIVHINSFNVSNFSQYEMGFTTRNHNLKIDLWLSRIDISLYYKDREISHSSLEAFSLPKMNETTKAVKFAVVASTNSGIKDKERQAIYDMGMDTRRKMVSFNVQMRDLVSVSAGKWYSKQKKMEILCQDLKVEFLKEGSGKLIDEENCSVRFLNS